jgi:hypothetical protein
VSRDPKQWRLELIVQKGSNGAGLPQILVRRLSLRMARPGIVPGKKGCNSLEECVCKRKTRVPGVSG